MPPTTTTEKASENESDSTSSATILLVSVIVVFVILLFFAVAFGIAIYFKKRKKSEEKKTASTNPTKKVKIERTKVKNVSSECQKSIQPPSSQMPASSSAAPNDDEKTSRKLVSTNAPSLSKAPTVENREDTTRRTEMVTVKKLPKEVTQDLEEVSAKGDEDDDDDENEEPIDMSKLKEVESAAEKAHMRRRHNEEIKQKQQQAEKDKMIKAECVKKIKALFETPDWDKKHMPRNCDYHLLTVSSPILRFHMMNYLREHADLILTDHGYRIIDEQATVPREAFEWLRSSEVTEEDAFLKCRAWMVENWSVFKRDPITHWHELMSMEIPLLYMAAMKDTIAEPELLDRILKQVLHNAVEYFANTPKDKWQLHDHPMKVLAKIYEENKHLIGDGKPTENTDTTKQDDEKSPKDVVNEQQLKN